MACTARVLVVDNALHELRAIADKLAGEGFESLRASTDAEALVIAGDARPDIVIIGDTPDHGAIELGEALRNATPTRDIQVLLMSDKPVPRNAGEIAGFLPRVCNEVELFTRLHALARLTTMRTELDRRADTASKYGIDMAHEVERPDQVSNARVLLLGNRPEELELLALALKGSAVTATCETTFDAVERLNREDFDAVIADARPGDNPVLEFCADIRGNVSLHNTPILLIAEPGSFDEPAAPFRAGASDVIHRPLDKADLRARTGALVSQKRYRQAMQRTYREALHIATSDSLTGLYSHGFLHEHLHSQIADASSRDKHLSIGFFDIARMAAVNIECGYAAGDHLVRQVGGLIGKLVRGEDLAARYSGEEFCVVLPETAEKEAVYALHRIAGVINHTEFALPGHDAPFSVKLDVGSAALEPGDTPELLILRARANLA